MQLMDVEQQKQDGFNRYMVECELKKHLNPLKAGAVLIDTWWNVN